MAAALSACGAQSVSAQNVLGGVLDAGASGQVSGQAAGPIGGQAGAQVTSPANGGTTLGGALQGALNNGIQNGVNAAANAAAQGQGLRGAVGQGVNGAVDGAVRGNPQLNPNVGGNANATSNGNRTDLNGQLNLQQSAPRNTQGFSVRPDGALQFNAGSSQLVGNRGIQTNDKIMDASGRIVTDERQASTIVTSGEDFRVLRNGQIVQIQSSQISSDRSHSESHAKSVEQKLALIEKLVREVREELAGAR